jgi:hypothetical protein
MDQRERRLFFLRKRKFFLQELLAFDNRNWHKPRNLCSNPNLITDFSNGIHVLVRWISFLR